MKKKIDIVKELLANGQNEKALSIASKWPRLGKYRDDILNAQSALLSPSFYKQIGKDPIETFKKGVASLKAHVGYLDYEI